MDALDHNSLLPSHAGRGTFCGKARSEGPDLDIDRDALSDTAVRGLIDDFLVPTIVEGLIRDLTCLGADE